MKVSTRVFNPGVIGMKGSILIVEQLETLAGVLKSQLQDSGFLVSGVASSIEEAIKMAAKAQPDVILVDTQVPGASTIVAQLKGLKNQRIIFLAFSEMEISSEQENSPYLIKPFSANTLIQRINQCLNID